MPLATSTGRERRRRTPPTNQPPSTAPSRSGMGRSASHWPASLWRSSPGLHLKDGEQRAERDGRNDRGEDDRDHSDRGRLSDVETLEGYEIKQERNVGRVFAGAAMGQHENRVKGLHDEK